MMMCVVEFGARPTEGPFPNDELAADYARLHCGGHGPCGIAPRSRHRGAVGAHGPRRGDGAMNWQDLGGALIKAGAPISATRWAVRSAA